MIVTPHQSRLPCGSLAVHADLLHAEWTKFRTVRGWVIGLLVAARAIMALGLAPARGFVRNGRPRAPRRSVRAANR